MSLLQLLGVYEMVMASFSLRSFKLTSDETKIDELFQSIWWSDSIACCTMPLCNLSPCLSARLCWLNLISIRCLVSPMYELSQSLQGILYITFAVLEIGTGSLGLDNKFLSVVPALKCTLTSCGASILLTYSESPLMYGTVTCYLCVESLVVWSVGWLCFLMNDKGYPLFCKDSVMCCSSSSCLWVLLGMVLALWLKVRTTADLCWRGWWELKFRYWSVCVLFR